ncbi:MAG: DUF4189 domain-containing protein [Chakrabartia sp.]
MPLHKANNNADVPYTKRVMGYALFSFFCIAIAALVPAQSAWAQVYICGSGPGPGERQVGATNAGNGVDSVALCERVDTAPAAPQGYWADSYATVVWAYTQDGKPTYSWATGWSTQKAADLDALQLCTKTNLISCRVGIQFSNGYFAIAKADDGALFGGSEFTKGKATRIAMQTCKSAKKTTCKVVETQRSRAQWIGN